ncbi:hypothetical protein JOM56_004789 [Amanita muscaria]
MSTFSHLGVSAKSKTLAVIILLVVISAWSPTSRMIKVSSSYTESTKRQKHSLGKYGTSLLKELRKRRLLRIQSSILPNIVPFPTNSRTISGSLSNPITLRSWPGGGRGPGQCSPFHPCCQPVRHCCTSSPRGPINLLINLTITAITNIIHLRSFCTRDRRLQDPYSNPGSVRVLAAALRTWVSSVKDQRRRLEHLARRTFTDR